MFNRKKGVENIIKVKIKRHKDKNGGHNHIIMEEIEDKYVSVGMTTKKTKGKNSTHKNYRCEKDPLGKGKESYLRRQGTVDEQVNYAQKTQNGEMSPKDFEVAERIAKRAKEKHLEKKSKKK